MTVINQDLLWIERLQFNAQGLIPALAEPLWKRFAQDYQDNTVLMLAWMNRESIYRTLATGKVHYWSRFRSELWHKGATSGHFQRVKQLLYDCDSDALKGYRKKYALTTNHQPMTSTIQPLPPKLEKILQKFQRISEAKQRYEYVLWFAKRLPPFPDEDKIPAHRVPGCASQVHL